jgi:hypothetical protein
MIIASVYCVIFFSFVIAKAPTNGVLMAVILIALFSHSAITNTMDLFKIRRLKKG